MFLTGPSDESSVMTLFTTEGTTDYFCLIVHT